MQANTYLLHTHTRSPQKIFFTGRKESKQCAQLATVTDSAAYASYERSSNTQTYKKKFITGEESNYKPLPTSAAYASYKIKATT
jgi:hypothetical protein